MHPKWIIGIVTIWILLALIGGVLEGAYLGTGEGTEQGVLNTMANSPLFTSTTLVGKIVGAIFDWSAWDAFFKMFLFDFAMFEGFWMIAQWIFFLPLAIALIVCLGLAVIRGVSSA